MIQEVCYMAKVCNKFKIKSRSCKNLFDIEKEIERICLEEKGDFYKG